MKYKTAYDQVVENRNIQYLVHFTRVSNLPSIFKHGIVPNYLQPAEKICAACNDKSRWDCSGASCLSVSFPNYKLFYRFRAMYPDEKWAIILLDPELLNHCRCAFSFKNAACREIRSRDLNTLMNPEAFGEMFAEPNDWRTRAQMMTSRNETTDPQAEILAFDTISPEYIKYVLIKDADSIIGVEEKMAQRDYDYFRLDCATAYFSSGRRQHISYFDRRPDYRYWRY